MVSVFYDNGINGADIADCANSDVFAGLVTGVPALQAKRCFRSLVTYFDKHKSSTASTAAGSTGSGSSVVAPPRPPAAKTLKVIS